MKSFEPQIRLRKVLLFSAVLPSLTLGNLPYAFADHYVGATKSATTRKHSVVPAKSKATNKSEKTESPVRATKSVTGSGKYVGEEPESVKNASTGKSETPANKTASTGKSETPANKTASTGKSETPTAKTVTTNKSETESNKPAANSKSATEPSKPAVESKDFAKLFAPPGKAQAAPLPGAGEHSTSTAPPGTASGGNRDGKGSVGDQNKTDKPGLGESQGPFSDNKPADRDNKGAGANKGPVGESYPSVGRMENLTFGATFSDSPIEQRLTKLETAIYQKSFADQSLFDRTQQLKKTLLGNDDEPTADIDNLRMPSTDWLGNPLGGNPLMTTDPGSSEFDFYGGIAQRPENQQTTTPADMKQFMLELINAERSKSGLGPLTIDTLADKLAQEQNDELCKRNVVSHANLKGENPDRRYTVNGGTGALTESIVTNKTSDTFSQSPTRAAVALLMKTLMSRQDDREAILNQDATNIGLSINWSPSKDKVIAVTEVITNHAIIPELPKEVAIGEKLEIKGVVMQPYQFDRITLAWEANKGLASIPDESDEALPYFPPLDYVAYATKSAKDYSGAMSALRAAGVIAAIAGGVFVPPVALAAPLIAMSGGVGTSDPKPVSDIPIHGGVKVEGLTFNGRVPINKDGKEGIYYVTIWGTLSKTGKPVPISRRAIVAKHVDEDVSARIETAADLAQNDKNGDDKEQKKKEKHHKSK